jgi:hypothetical protein
MGEKRTAWRVLVGMPERNRPLGRPRQRWVGNIKTVLRYDGVVWTGLIWLRTETNGELV